MWFLKKGGDFAFSINSKNNSAKGILNLLEFSHIIFTPYIQQGVTVVNSTTYLNVV